MLPWSSGVNVNCNFQMRCHMQGRHSGRSVLNENMEKFWVTVAMLCEWRPFETQAGQVSNILRSMPKKGKKRKTVGATAEESKTETPRKRQRGASERASVPALTIAPEEPLEYVSQDGPEWSGMVSCMRSKCLVDE